MIKGFELDTKPLSDEELKIAEVMRQAFNTYPKGAKHKKKAYYFIEKLKTLNFKVSEPRFRKLIQHLRVNDLTIGLCSDGSGYWIAETAEELTDTIMSLRDRIINQTATFNALKRQLIKNFSPASDNQAHPLF